MRLSKIVDFTEDIAPSAAMISLKHHIHMADSMILATARKFKAVLWTRDEHFSGLDGVNYKKT